MRANHVLMQKLDAALQRGLLLRPSTHAERQALRQRTSNGEVVQPYPGLFARADSHGALNAKAQALTLLRTLSGMHPDWTFCLYSAALMHGLQVSYAQLGLVHVCVGPTQSRRRCRGSVQCHVRSNPPITTIQGIPVTSIEQTVVDCLCCLDFRKGLALVDSALHLGLTSPSSLIGFVDALPKRRQGIRRVRKALRYMDGRSENGGESIARAAIIELGFAVPELQALVEDPLEPNNPKRVDFLWVREDGTRIIGEFDGAVKYRGPHDPQGATLDAAIRTLSKERRRESHLNLTGATVVRFSLADVYDNDAFYQLLASAGVPFQM